MTSMIERTIVLPMVDNDGQSNEMAIHQIEGELLAIAGGFSESSQIGYWLDADGTLYKNESERLYTSVDSEHDALIAERLPVWCERLHQLSLYTSAHSVLVDFVEPVSIPVVA